MRKEFTEVQNVTVPVLDIKEESDKGQIVCMVYNFVSDNHTS